MALPKTRFLKVGERDKHDGRIVEAVTTPNTMLSPLSHIGKDTKNITNEKKSRKRRAVVSANEGPIVRISNFKSKFLNRAAD